MFYSDRTYSETYVNDRSSSVDTFIQYADGVIEHINSDKNTIETTTYFPDGRISSELSDITPFGKDEWQSGRSTYTLRADGSQSFETVLISKCLVAERCWDRVRWAIEEYTWRFDGSRRPPRAWWRI